MFKRFLVPALAIIAIAAPSYGQPKNRPNQIPAPVQTSAAFRALFKPVVETPAKSTVRILVDGKEAVLGVIVSDDGYIVTKASELKSDRVSVRTQDGRAFDGKVTGTSEMFDLAVVKVEGTGLTPITWATSTDEPVGNWLAVAGNASEPVAVGVMSTSTRVGPHPYGPQRVRTEKSGFLGVQLDSAENGAIISAVTPDSSAAKAGLLPKDKVIRINDHLIDSQDVMIYTLLGFTVGDTVKIVLIRDGKQMEIKALLGKPPTELVPPKGKGSNRGDFQNNMGSTLSEQRGGFPRFFQTDAVVKPSDCGGPVVDLDGRAIGLMIARAGRTESWAIPAETMKELVPVLIASKDGAPREKRIEWVREALKKAEEAKYSAEVIAEGKRILNVAVAEDQWWKDHPLEKAPSPRVVTVEHGPAPRAVNK